jgi:hypothetical protein
MAENELRLYPTIHIGQAEQGVLVGAHRVVADVEELHAGTEDFSRRHGFLTACVLDLGFGHFTLAPQLGRLAALTERQANHVHCIALLSVQRNGTTGTPDKVSGMCADHQGGFL